MTLIPWKPFFDLEKFFEDDDWLMPVFPRLAWGKPAMDIKETDKEIIAELEIPGFDPEKVEVSVSEGVLRVRGTQDETKEEKKENYWRREISRGSFERVVRLPTPVKEDAVKASYEKGILRIVMPKAQTKPSTKIKIQVKKEK